MPPRKSSKTAHVLNLLTSNKEDNIETDEILAEIPAETEKTSEKSVSVPEKTSKKVTSNSRSASKKTTADKEIVAETLQPEESDDISKQIEKVSAEIIDESIHISEPINEMKETVSEILSDHKEEAPLPEMHTVVPTMEQINDYDIHMHTESASDEESSVDAPFSYVPPTQNTIPDIMPSPLPKSAVASMIIAQKKAEEKITEEPETTVEIASETPVYEEKDMTLVNLTEKSAAKRIPDIMKKFNMCTCERCYYDVLALTLNSVPQKTVIVPRDDIEKKIKEYELDATIDMVTAISKSCVHVKISPRH